MNTKVVNYTEDQTAEVVNAYKEAPTKETVEALALKLGKSVKSITAKLSREGVYKAKQDQAAKAKPKQTKQDLINTLATMLNVDPAKLQTLEKASKEALETLVAGNTFEQE